MMWRVEFQVLTTWYKKDCCSLVLFINGIVSMREVELRVGQECPTLDFVKYRFRLHGCCLWYKICLDKTLGRTGQTLGACTAAEAM